MSRDQPHIFSEQAAAFDSWRMLHAIHRHCLPRNIDKGSVKRVEIPLNFFLKAYLRRNCDFFFLPLTVSLSLSFSLVDRFRKLGTPNYSASEKRLTLEWMYNSVVQFERDDNATTNAKADANAFIHNGGSEMLGGTKRRVPS